MKKTILSFAIATMVAVGLVACVNTPTDPTPPVEQDTVQKPVEPEEEAIVRDEDFYDGLLEAFCQEYFDDGYGFGFVYERNSLFVRSMEPRGSKTVIVKGTLSYTFQKLRKCKDGGFSAIITDTGRKNRYVINFTRNGGGRTKRLKSLPEKVFVYEPVFNK